MKRGLKEGTIRARIRRCTDQLNEKRTESSEHVDVTDESSTTLNEKRIERLPTVRNRQHPLVLSMKRGLKGGDLR